MAIIDRVKFDGLRSRDWIVYKHPAEDLVYGTQLIVGEGQIAVFVKGGEICDLFSPGTYTLDAKNLPILKAFVNLPFGGKTPFSAEIFYINTTTKLDINWGTSDPVQIIDPKYYTRLRVRAFGQMGLKLDNYETFFRELIGVMNPAELIKFDNVIDFFKGILIQKIKSIIANVIVNQKISALEITARLDDIANYALEMIAPEFSKYGLIAINLIIKSINFPDEDFEEINKILKSKAEFEIMGDNRYVTKRSFDVYDQAAGNNSGVAGVFASGGVGFGIGASLGSDMHNTINTKAATDTATLACPSCSAENSAKSKFCCECGKPLETPKKKCISCGALVTGNPKFCPECGTPMGTRICECGTEIPIGTKFCPQCGKKL